MKLGSPISRYCCISGLAVGVRLVRTHFEIVTLNVVDVGALSKKFLNEAVKVIV